MFNRMGAQEAVVVELDVDVVDLLSMGDRVIVWM